jgi:hypothetical protein
MFFQSLFDGNAYNKSPIYAGKIKGIIVTIVKIFTNLFSASDNSGSSAKNPISLKKGLTKLKTRYTQKKLNKTIVYEFSY